jgi:hypothetical protein
MRIIEELLGIKSSGTGKDDIYGRRDPLRGTRNILYLQKSALAAAVVRSV